MAEPAPPPDGDDAGRLYGGLRSGLHGLSEREAARRLTAYGRNELIRRGRRQRPRRLAEQLLRGIASEIAFAATLIYAAPLHSVFGTVGLSVPERLVLLPFPAFVWGDEIRRAQRRRHGV